MKLSYAFVVILLLLGGCQSHPHKDLSAEPDFNDPVAHVVAGNRAAKSGKFEIAKQEYETALHLDPNFQTAKRNIGIVFVKLGLFQTAIEQLKGVLHEYPKDPEVYYFLGEGYRGLSLYTEALQYYEAGLKLAPEDDRIIKSIAWVYLKQKKTQQAMQLAKQLYQKDPQDIQVLIILSHGYLQNKEYKHVLGILMPFEEAHYRVKSANKELAETEKIILLEALGDGYSGLAQCEKAQRVYGQILLIRPFLASALLKSAICDFKEKRFTQAQEKLNKAQAADPENPDVLFWLGRIYTVVDPKKSEFYYQRFIERSR